MITISFRKNPQEEILSFKVEGHSYYDESGQDIICASASTLLYTAIGAIEEITGFDNFYQIYPDSEGDMPEAEVSLPDTTNHEQEAIIQIIFKTIWVGFKQLEEAAKAYGDQYVRIVESLVDQAEV